jgi:hypothetical protein
VCYPDLIETPIYQQAMRTPPVINRHPARMALAEREQHLRDAYQIREAGLRLDHLVRRALDPNYSDLLPPVYLCSAIKAFLELIEARLPSMSFPEPDQAHGFIAPRLALCREIIARTDRALIAAGYNPITSAGFRQVVLQYGVQVEDIVFDNPLLLIDQMIGPFGRTGAQQEFLTKMRSYWD